MTYPHFVHPVRVPSRVWLRPDQAAEYNAEEHRWVDYTPNATNAPTTDTVLSVAMQSDSVTADAVLFAVDGHPEVWCMRLTDPHGWPFCIGSVLLCAREGRIILAGDPAVSKVPINEI